MISRNKQKGGTEVRRPGGLAVAQTQKKKTRYGLEYTNKLSEVKHEIRFVCFWLLDTEDSYVFGKT